MDMQTYNNLFNKVCSYENLLRAFNNAKKGKTNLPYVIQFSENLTENLLQLQKELKSQAYKPAKLTRFIIKDPKLRVISKSIFRDRIVHHAIVQILEPLIDPTFIYDSYANRVGKGTNMALERCQLFLRQSSKSGWGGGDKENKNIINGYALKADIKRYFEAVDQEMLLKIIRKKIKDEKLLSLVRTILHNFNAKIKGIGMPLGNLTSQFFANVYLNELDQFVKHELKVRYYMRYVDDFVIIHKSKEVLEYYKQEITRFLTEILKLQLHPGKSKIIPLFYGIPFVGFRIFCYHKLIRKKATKRIKAKLKMWEEMNELGLLEKYTTLEKLIGWMAYAKNGNTYYLRKKVMARFNKLFEEKTR